MPWTGVDADRQRPSILVGRLIQPLSLTRERRRRLAPMTERPNTFHILDDRLRAWSLTDDVDVPWKEWRYFRDLLLAFDGEHPLLGLRFVLTARLGRSESLAGRDVVVICVCDELARMPAYSHDVRLVAKTYGVRLGLNLLGAGDRSLPLLLSTLVQEGSVHIRRLPSHLGLALHTVQHRGRPNVVDLPLGIYLLEQAPLLPFGDRPFDVSYAGSRYNKTSDPYRKVPTRKMQSRRALAGAVETVRTSRPDTKVAVHVIDQFQDAEAHSAEYTRALMESRITLCPRGGSLETYRFFEAMKCGTIPVCERLPDREFYSGSPAVTVRRWSELPAVLDRLLSDPAALEARHRAVLRWWEDHCSPAACARRLATALDIDPA